MINIILVSLNTISILQRPLYRHYYQNTNALIYVVDSKDEERFEQVKEELQSIMKEDELKGIPLLVLANKQDLVGAATPETLYQKLGLDTIRMREFSEYICLYRDTENDLNSY